MQPLSSSSQAGNDPVPGGRKPPLIPPSLLLAEKEKEKEREKEKAKEVANAATVAVKTEKEEEAKPATGEEKTGDNTDMKPLATSPGRITNNAVFNYF